MEDGMDISLKIRNKTTIWPSNPTPRHIPQGNQNKKKDTCIPLFITALFTLARTWKQPRCPSTAAAAKSLQSCPTLCVPIDGSPPGSPSLGFSRQEHWSGLPFPSPMRESEVAQSCLTLSDPMDCSRPGSSIHGIFPGKSTGVGCHCLLQSINRWMDKEVVVYIHNRVLLSHEKEVIWVSSNEVGEPRTYYIEWSETEREK